jgi:hypothetical protein
MSTVHASRSEHEAIDSHRPVERFKISSAWALLAGSLAEIRVSALITLYDEFLPIEICNVARSCQSLLSALGVAI